MAVAYVEIAEEIPSYAKEVSDKRGKKGIRMVFRK